jgi:hypothetical protein
MGGACGLHLEMKNATGLWSGGGMLIGCMCLKIGTGGGLKRTQ